MSIQSENRWFLVEAAIQPRQSTRRSWAWAAGRWLVIVAVLALGYETGALPALLARGDLRVIFPILVIVTLGGSFWLQLRRVRAERARYVAALQAPGPEAVVATVLASGGDIRRNVDVLRANALAVAFALYGHEKEASAALSTIEWGSKAPLVQAIGLSAEGMVALLCHRDARRALELFRHALAMSDAGGSLGAAMAARSHAAFVAVAEALLGLESPRGLEILSRSVAVPRYPALQLLAALGLSAVLERSGERDRAAELRAFIRRTAPHCAPLMLPAEAFSGAGQVKDGTEPGQTAAVPVSAPFIPDSQARIAKHALLLWLARKLGLWALLILMFVALRLLVGR